MNDKRQLAGHLLTFGITTVILNPIVISVYLQDGWQGFNWMLTGAGICAVVTSFLVRKLK